MKSSEQMGDVPMTNDNAEIIDDVKTQFANGEIKGAIARVADEVIRDNRIFDFAWGDNPEGLRKVMIERFSALFPAPAETGGATRSEGLEEACDHLITTSGGTRDGPYEDCVCNICGHKWRENVSLGTPSPERSVPDDVVERASIVWFEAIRDSVGAHHIQWADDNEDAVEAKEVIRIGMAALASASLLREPAPGWQVVPKEPTEKMWGGLARQIVLWMRFDRATGQSLYAHLKASGREIPEWLRAEIPDTDHVPPKGTVAVCIYKAMLAEAQGQ